MGPSQGTRGANWIFSATAPALLVAGLVLAGWITTWSAYAWAAHDGGWLLTYGSATFLALALPVTFLGFFERWQVKHGLDGSSSSNGAKALNWACGLFATLLGLVACPFVLVCAYFTWGFWSDGMPAASVYFAVVAVAMLAELVGFLRYYDRWQTRSGLHRS